MPIGRFRLEPPEGEEGFTLIEVIAALVVFTIMSVAVVYSLLAAQSTTRSDRNRVVAANLLQQRLEQIRLLAAQANGLNTLTLGDTTCTGAACTPAASIDGVNYTVTQNASWVAAAASADPCASTAGASKYAYMHVTVTASWPGLGAQVPPRDDSVFTPALTDGGAATGSFPVKITSAANLAEAGVSVSLLNAGGSVAATMTTDKTGCALFTGLTPGTYTPKSTAPLLVDYYGLPTHTGPAGVVVAGQQAQVSTWQLDTAATASFAATPDVTAGGPFTVPANLAATVENTSVTPFFVANPSAPTATFAMSSLFPYPAGDMLWAGSCADADPRMTGGSLGATMPLSPGMLSTSGGVKVHSTVVTVKKGATLLTGAHVYALHAAGTGCVGMTGPDGNAYGEVYDLGTTTATGVVKTAVPYGTWTFKVFGSPTGSATSTLNASSAGTASSIALAVS